MSAHNEVLNVEVQQDKRALEQLKAKVGHLEANINEFMVHIGDISKGTGGAGAVVELSTP